MIVTCPEGCTCGRHRIPVCVDGCTCYRHQGKVYSSSSYKSNHARVNKIRGKARARLCTFCLGQGAEWAQVHEYDGTNPWSDFIPLCNKCHRKYDHIAERLTGIKRSEETRAKLSAARTGTKLSDERKAEIAEFFRGRPKSAEHRAKISAALKGRRRPA